MSGAFDSTFQAPIPGISIGHHKLGELPHEKPPEYTKPEEALEYFWKLLIQPRIQRQIWAVLKMPSATVQAVTHAILYKAAMQGIIQMNLAVVINPTVGQMVYTIAKAGGINAKIGPKTKSKYKEQYIKDGLKQLMLKYDKNNVLKPNWKNHVASMSNIPSNAVDNDTQEADQQDAGATQAASGGPSGSGLLGQMNQPTPPQAGAQPTNGGQ